MAELSLGVQPVSTTVWLYRDFDFTATLRRKDGTNWPAGSTLELVITRADGTTVTWAATLTGTDALFSKDKADVNALIDAVPSKVKLRYTEGTTELVWGYGSAVVG